MPSCRIYPGALGLRCEKTQSAWWAPRLAAARVPLSGPLERRESWMNGRKRGRQRGGGSRGGGQRESSKWFQGAGPTWRERWVSRMLWYMEGRRNPPTHSLAHICKKPFLTSHLHICAIVSPGNTETTVDVYKTYIPTFSIQTSETCFWLLLSATGASLNWTEDSDPVNHQGFTGFNFMFVCPSYKFFSSLLQISGVEAVRLMLHGLCCQKPVHQSRACRCVQTRSWPWIRAHLPEPGKAHGQVVNKWKWKIATPCGACSSTCKRERWSGHDGCPMSLLSLIWSKKYLGQPLPTPLFTTIIDKQMWPGRCKHRKLPVCKIAFGMRNFVYLLCESNHIFESK